MGGRIARVCWPFLYDAVREDANDLVERPSVKTVVLIIAMVTYTAVIAASFVDINKIVYHKRSGVEG